MIIKLNLNMLGYKKGNLVDLNKVVNSEYCYFMRRLRDAEIDNCVEIVEQIKKVKEINQEA